MDCQLNPSGDGKDYLSFQPLLLSSSLVNTQINLQAASDTGVGLNPRDLDLEPTAVVTPLPGMLQRSPQRDVPADAGSQDHLLSGGQGGLRKDGEELAARMVPNAAGRTAAQITVTGLDRTGTDTGQVHQLRAGHWSGAQSYLHRTSVTRPGSAGAAPTTAARPRCVPLCREDPNRPDRMPL